MLSETDHNRYLEDMRRMHVCNVLTNMETDIELFETLRSSYPSQLRSVKNTTRRHTNY
jgi:hypothetical protein